MCVCMFEVDFCLEHMSTVLMFHVLRQQTVLGTICAGQNLGTASKYGWFNISKKAADQLAHLSPNARVQVERNGRTLRVPTHEAMLQEVLTRVPESYIRRQVSIQHAGPISWLFLVLLPTCCRPLQTFARWLFASTLCFSSL